MIYFVVRDLAGRYPITMFLAGWGKRLTPDVRVLDYDSLFRRKPLHAGSYIFCDLEYLDDDAVKSAIDCWEALRESGMNSRYLNHPRDVLRRYDLLRSLHESGVNDFNVYRLRDDASRFRFPVFLREETDHDGPRSELLNSSKALETAILAAEDAGADLKGWMVTEFCECRGDDGLYRKYGAFNVGGQIIPRHLLFAHEWMVKGTSRQISQTTLAEERDYIETSPHEAELREIFSAAKIDYGRADYTVHDGKIRVFEINTNPQIVMPGPSRDHERTPIKTRFAERFVAALEMCNSTAPHRATVAVNVRYAQVRTGKITMSERTISFTSAIGLVRFEPQILRQLFALRAFWRTCKGRLWERTPRRLRDVFSRLRQTDVRA